MGMQPGYTKHCCFLCEWDSRERQDHYVVKDWTRHTGLVPGQKSVVYPPHVDPGKIYLPPLHIKLGLMKNFVKAMNKTGPGFQYLQTKFPRINEAKLKERIFVGPQIREVFNDDEFDDNLNFVKLRAWDTFKDIAQPFLGSHPTV